MQKHVNLVDLVKSFPTNIFLQNFASIQQRTSLIKFDHLDEKSEYGSMSSLSTKVPAGHHRADRDDLVGALQLCRLDDRFGPVLPRMPQVPIQTSNG